MSEFTRQAIDKLDSGEQSKFSDKKQDAMKRAVHDALCEFCNQDYEFAQAVVQGGSFADCMAAVAKGVGGSISDLEAYRRAVRFFFPGSDVVFQMKIALCEADKTEAGTPARFGKEDRGRGYEDGGHGGGMEQARSDADSIVLDLADFL